MNKILDIVVSGEPKSKANSRKIARFGGTPRVIKSKAALDYCRSFEAQVPQRGDLYGGDVAVYMKIWYSSRRPDLCEDLVLDLLQGVGYSNDRQVRVKLVFWGKSKDNPRTHIVVAPIEEYAELFQFCVDEHLEDWEEPKR